MKRYRNTKMVTVRQDRTCCHCKSVIPKGTRCLTLNPKGQGRHWLCNGCVSLYNDVMEARAILDATPFDDEGGAYANADFLNEAIGRWESMLEGEDTFLDQRIEQLGGHL